MNLLIIDGQGGGIGKTLTEQIKAAFPSYTITAAGTNALATSAMMKAGADLGATGENAIIYNCRYADIILGPIGIIIANSLLGEVSASIAAAVSSSEAKKILIPITKCSTHIVGIENKPLNKYIEEAVKAVKEIVK
ncbi:MAG: DUF3842 family protein [Eubacteriaceae bacterium]|nr:DUF3842 family protein [Eubacteriaceae bacterium]